MPVNIPSPTSEKTLKTATATGGAIDINNKKSTNHDKEYHYSDTSKKTTTKKKKQELKKTHNDKKKSHNSTSKNHHLDNKKSQSNSTTTTIKTAGLLPSASIEKPTWIPYPTPTHGNEAIAAFDNNSLSSSSSMPAGAVAEAEHADSTLAQQFDEEYNTNTKSKDALMGSMLGVLGGISVLLITIIIFASHRRRKGIRNASDTVHPRERRGWGVRHSWYSASDSSVTSQCPSSLPPPYEEKKRESILKPPSPTVTKSTQYIPQLAYSPSFSVESRYLVQESITNQKEPLPPPPPPAASFTMTTTINNGNSNCNNYNNNTGGTTISTTTPSTFILSSPNIQHQHRHQQHEQLPLPSGPAPRPSRSLVRTYQAQLDNNKIGSILNDPNYP
ncbi:hypothetical protein INT45_002524 [Circinella minor]|uniref:Uncharacterized protein n=1 Tax=Circinella minor TaxID=1195481 RepID=A0A8H7VRG4_9FUNG|nr:hypothetical protein INT45_002524 [Circinella minor]